jgi:hypothetical protein
VTELSRSGTFARRMQDAALALLHEHEADGQLPTNGRFLFYEAEGRGLVRRSGARVAAAPPPTRVSRS